MVGKSEFVDCCISWLFMQTVYSLLVFRVSTMWVLFSFAFSFAEFCSQFIVIVNRTFSVI